LLAAQAGRWEAVRALLKRGASARAAAPVSRGSHRKLSSGGGETALHLAARAGLLPEVRVLVEAGADPAARTSPGQLGAGRTVLHDAAQGGQVSVLAYLLGRGAPLVPAESGETPLHHAAWRGGAEAVRFLLGRGQRVDARTRDGDTPLQYAAGEGQIASIEALVAHGARLDEQNDAKQTLLHLAAEDGRRDTCTWLLARGLAVDAVDRFGRTPLWYAAQGHLDTVVALVEARARVDLRDENGLTPEAAATRHGDPEIAAFLRQAALRGAPPAVP
jgi:ankyrin repeat protein